MHLKKSNHLKKDSFINTLSLQTYYKTEDFIYERHHSAILLCHLFNKTNLFFNNKSKLKKSNKQTI